jgi:hypothetical protein
MPFILACCVRNGPKECNNFIPNWSCKAGWKIIGVKKFDFNKINFKNYC